MDKRCTVYRTVSFVGKKWTLLILLELYKKKTKWKRYSQLKNSLMDITPKMLSDRLKELEKGNLIVKRVDAKHAPIKCEYSLTSSGREFIEVVKDLKKWGLKWNLGNPVCESSKCENCEF